MREAVTTSSAMKTRITLNDGQTIPDLAFGSGTRRSEGAVAKSTEHLLSALNKGFRHLDTAQRQSALIQDGFAYSE